MCSLITVYTYIRFKTQNLKQILEFVSKVFSFTLCKYEFWADKPINRRVLPERQTDTQNSDTPRYSYKKTEPLTLLGLFGTSSGVSHFTAHVLHIF